MEDTNAPAPIPSAQSFQARFVTKQTKYSINDAEIAIDSSVTPDQLNEIVKSLIKESGYESDTESSSAIDKLKFEFLVAGRLLRQTIDKHDFDSEEYSLSEKVIDIEYFIAAKSPRPVDYVPHQDWVSCLAANDKYLLTGCYDNTVHIWSLDRLKGHVRKKKDQGLDGSFEIEKLVAHESPINDIQWIKNEDDSGASARDDNASLLFITVSHDTFSMVRRWTPKTRKIEVVAKLRGHARSVNCVDNLGPDLIATGSYDQTLRLWSLSELNSDESETESKTKTNGDTEKRDLTAVSTLTGHKESITGVRWMDKRTVATCSMDNTIRTWNMEDGQSVLKFQSSKSMMSMDYCPRLQLILTASCDRHVRLWDPRDNKSVMSTKAAFTSHAAWTSSVTFSRDPKHEYLFVSGGYDNVVKQWDIRCINAPLYDLIGHHDRVLCVDWSNGDYVFSGSADNTARIFAN